MAIPNSVLAAALEVVRPVLTDDIATDAATLRDGLVVSLSSSVRLGSIMNANARHLTSFPNFNVRREMLSQRSSIDAVS